MAKTTGKITSIYLDEEARDKLAELAAVSGLSRSLVVRNLVLKAGSQNRVKMRKLVTQLSDLVDAT